MAPADAAGDPDARSRFEREARAIAALNHPHICTLYDVGHDERSDYLVMELVEGETLASRLERGSLPVAHAVAIAQQIAGALDRAHRQGIVHRDLKPANIMIVRGSPSAAPNVKLLDFGLARLVVQPAVSFSQGADVTRATQGRSLAPAPFSAPSTTCHRSRWREKTPITDLTSSRWGACCTRC